MVKMEKQGKTGEDESQPSIDLGLGIGGPTSFCNSGDHQIDRLKNNNDRIVMVEDDHQVILDEEREKKLKRNTEFSVVCFTEEQLEELKTQCLIFKYMVSGLPVPLQLVVPIWRSFSFEIYRRAPLVLGFFRLGFDNRYMMDPEPGRCRRTDGKKWRCHQAVVPNEKYCERHMHRGRKRSRKLVEASTREASANSGTLNLLNANRNSSNDDITFATNLDESIRLSTCKNPMGSYSSVRGNNDDKNGPTRVLIRAPGVTNSAAKSNENYGQHNVRNHSSIIKERITAMNVSSGLDFSPKSVLQGGQKSRKVENLDNNPISEPGRCRRTDGKKWRCSNGVILNQKYCAHHMNRGSKKPAVALSASVESKIACAGSSSAPKFYRVEQGKMGLDLHTNLDISLTTSSTVPRQTIFDNNNENAGDCGGSGSTTETTVTDDSTDDVSDMITLSP